MRDGRITREAQHAAARHDRGRGGAGAAQQLPADTGAVVGRAARARGPRLPAAAHAYPGDSRRARSRGRVSARRDRAGGTAAAVARAHPAGARGAARLCQALAQSRAAAVERARRSLSRPRTRPLLPPGAGGEIPRRHRPTSPTPRDRGHPAHQLHDQPQRRRGGHAHRRPDQRLGRVDRRRLRGGARQLRHDRAQYAIDTLDNKVMASCSELSKCAGPARPPGLVPAQRRPDARARHHCQALRASIAAVGGARHRPARGRRRRGAVRADG